MPKFINPYSGGADGGIGSALASIADSIFGKEADRELKRQKALELIRQNENIPLLAEAVRGLNPTEARYRGILGGKEPDYVGGYLQGETATRKGVESPEFVQAYMGQKGANYGNTPAGFARTEEMKRDIEFGKTQRLVESDERKFANTPIEVLVNGVPTIVSRKEAISTRAQPVLEHSKVRGGILATDAPKLDPVQRATAGGYDPKQETGPIYTYKLPTGQQGATRDGMTDLTTGQPIVSPEDAARGVRPAIIKLEGPTTEGLTGNKTIDRELLDARRRTVQAEGSIDRLVVELQKPNADQAVGYLGNLASTFNNLRSQVEATTRLAGGETLDQARERGVSKAAEDLAKTMFSNTTWNMRLRQLGITSAVLRSQIEDLAYTIAKTNDPGGKLSNDDVKRAGDVIGRTLMDPGAAVTVLQDLKKRVRSNHDIYERELAKMYPQVGGAAPPVARMPAAAPLAPAPVERWNIDPVTGLPIRVQ